jgi:uncharacterized membrane protein
MTAGLVLIAAFIGLWAGLRGPPFAGFALGAAIGYLLASVIRLRRRVDALEERRPLTSTVESRAPAATPAPVATAPMPAARPRVLEPAQPGPLARLLLRTRRWFTTGNVPVKVGVILTLLGVAFLLRYAVERELIVFPIELRLLLVAAAAMVLLVTGWRLRGRMRVYALSLQGGGLGILYLTIFAALRLYQLVPASLAFVLLVALTLGAGMLAVLQDARGLAVLGAVGGFLAPVLVSTGTGNHVVLFSWYLVLNALIVGVAWYRPWRELNLIGFVSTFVIGGLWLWRNYEPGLFATTEPFVILFFLLYQASAILYAWRRPTARGGVVDGTLVFATPVLVFATQARLLGTTEFGLAFSALAAAAFYVVTAGWLRRCGPPALRLLTEAYIALAVAFATLALPLALDARWTAASWALEGAALAWIGLRQGRALARAAGALLVIAAGCALMRHGWRWDQGPPVLNGNLLGGLLVAVSGFIAARFLERASGRWAGIERWAARGMVAWSVAWWVGAVTLEIVDRLPSRHQPAALVLAWAASGLALAAIAGRSNWSAARAAALASVPLLVLAFGAQNLGGLHPFAGFGWLAWPAAIALQLVMLRGQESACPRLTALAHPVVVALGAVVLMAEVAWQVEQPVPGAVWSGAAASLVPGLLVLGLFWLKDHRAWPVAAFPEAYPVWTGLILLALQGWLVARLNLGTDGDPEPLGYLPLANPVDLASLFALLCGWHWLRASVGVRRSGCVILGGIAFVVSTVALLRATHHLGGVPWRAGPLFASVLVQAALSIWWSALAFTGMVAGTRLLRRWLWLAGAALMAVVVAKLFLVDLGNTGTVARIVSFVGVGGLLLVVGYLAPAPPRPQENPDA